MRIILDTSVIKKNILKRTIIAVVALIGGPILFFHLGIYVLSPLPPELDFIDYILFTSMGFLVSCLLSIILLILFRFILLIRDFILTGKI